MLRLPGGVGRARSDPVAAPTAARGAREFPPPGPEGSAAALHGTGLPEEPRRGSHGTDWAPSDRSPSRATL